MRFFYPKGKKLKNLEFLGEILKLKPKPKMADPTQPNQSNKNLTQADTGQIFLTQTYHYF